MSTSVASPPVEPATATAGHRRLRPHQLVLGLGVVAGLFTLAVRRPPAAAPSWHDDSPISREVFGGIPGPLAARLLHGDPGAARVRRVRSSPTASGTGSGARPTAAARRPKNAKRRLADFRAGVYMQTLLRDPAAGIMHSLIYFGFLVLLGVTTVLEIDHQLPESAQVPARPRRTRPTRSSATLAGARVPRRHRLGHRCAATCSARTASASRPSPSTPSSSACSSSSASPASSPRCSASPRWARPTSRSGASSATRWPRWSTAGQLEHARRLAPGHVDRRTSSRSSPSCVILPITMLRHMFTSPLNMYLRDRDRPKGAMKPMPNLTETALETFGAIGRRGLHLEAAARHRRLHDVRPLHERVPGPRHRQAARPARDRAQDGRGHGRHRPPGRVARRSASTPRSPSRPTRCSSGSRAEEIWACTSCKACDEICPVNIEILDKILDMRRYLSLMESNFPTELGNAYRSMENQGNPWGMSQGERADWAKGLDVDDRRPGEPFTHEYLYWVGCAGSFDDKNKKVTQAMAKLLQRAGIDVAILGPSEMCTGDPARRSGNEYLFQMLAMPNIEMLNGMGVQQDHHAVPALLQHAEERVPAARRQLRGRPPQPVPRAADRDGPARRLARPRSRSGSRTTTPATSAATTTCTSRPAR